MSRIVDGRNYTLIIDDVPEHVQGKIEMRPATEDGFVSMLLMGKFDPRVVWLTSSDLVLMRSLIDQAQHIIPG